jgi:predicted nucleic acid-binding protein
MVLVDTAVWSIALRRKPAQLSDLQVQARDELAELIRDSRVVLIGPIRQEVLTGIRDERAFERLRRRLAAFEDDPLTTEDYETAAAIDNRCQRSGVRGSSIDLLICAAALRRNVPIFTMDADFDRYAELVGVKLYSPRPRLH